MDEKIFFAFLAYVLDLILGDPYGFPHPVIYMGRLVKILENFFRRFKKKYLVFFGILLWVIVVTVVFSFVYGVIYLIKIHHTAYVIFSVVFLWTCFSTKCLGVEAKKIYLSLKSKDIEKSRKDLSFIVGRNTDDLDEKEIIRAVVETVSENTVDGTISPMFYFFCGGIPLAFVYKAVNTMDSMLGYKNEKYKDIGMFSARMDDVFNFIPARISLFTIVVASFFLRFDCKNAFKIGFRDRKNHKSPNCAYSEGAVSGALGIQLGGTNIYFGEAVEKPTIGDARRELEPEDILRVNKILYLSTFIALILFSLLYASISVLF